MKFLLYILPILIFFSCVPEPEEELHVVPPILDTNDTSIKDTTLKYGKLLVLNEGLFRQGNASLSLIDLKDTSVINNVFTLVNGRDLGDTGNDMKMYGSKIYIVIHASSTVEVIEKHSFESLHTIHLLDDHGTARLPRNLAFKDDLMFVSNYDGTVISYDTTSFNVENIYQVGRNPEGISVHGNELIIANSGGLDSPNYDNRISVIDLETNLVTHEELDINLSSVLTHQNKSYIISRGNHQNIASELYYRENDDNHTIGIEATHLSYYNNNAIVIGGYNYNTKSSTIKVLNTGDHSIIEEHTFTNQQVNTLFGVNVGPDQTLYLSDANGFVSTGSIAFYKNQQLLNKVKVGLNPHSVLYIK